MPGTPRSPGSNLDTHISQAQGRWTSRAWASTRKGVAGENHVVRQLVAGKDYLFADRGDAALKRFDEPVRLFEVRSRD